MDTKAGHKEGDIIIITYGCYEDAAIDDAYKCLRDFNMTAFVAGAVKKQDGLDGNSGYMTVNLESELPDMLVSAGLIEKLSAGIVDCVSSLKEYEISRDDYEKAIKG